MVVARSPDMPKALVLSLAVGIFLTSTRYSEAEKTPIRTTVCELATYPQKYDNSLVRVTARIESDGFEYTDFFDEGCPRLALHFGSPAKLADTKSIALLSRAIEKVYFHGPNLKHLTVTATVTGEFYVHPEFGALHELRPISATNIDIHYGVPILPSPPRLKNTQPGKAQ